MELELGLALPNHSTPMEMEIQKRDIKKKSKFGEGFDQINGTEFEDKKLRLLLWSGQPNDEEDDRRRLLPDNKNDINEEESVIVGWPPINSLRKEMLHQYHQYLHRDDDNINGVIMRNMQSLYVKVKMEGVAIGRKIDLRLFNSYQTLKIALLNMFSKHLKFDISGTEYSILYQDKQGGWMLAGDVPWEVFIESVQRMEILRNGGR